MVDVPGNSSTTSFVTVGSTTSGTLETLGDHDWYRIDLTAGQSITIQVNGVTLEDPYLYVRNSSGTLLYENDDIQSGVVRDSQLAFTANYTGAYYIDVGAWDEGYTGTYQIVVSTYSPPPVFNNDQIAYQLTNGYWGGSDQHWNVTQGGTITYNVTALTSGGQNLARQALALWSDIIGVTFQEVTSGGQITFDDNEEGAFADSTVNAGGFITSSHVNVSTQWLANYGTSLDSYAFQTYIHEIGHALGLGHAGNYNGSARYPYDALFSNDSWATTVMSYFDQNENTYFAGQGFTEEFLATPMVADIIAMSNLYGLSTTTRTGNTTYGFNSTANRDIFNATLYPDVSYTVFDSGGTDTLDYSGYSGTQRIDLNPEAFSNVLGNVGNVSIARGTIIENAIGGSGNDTLIGNAVANALTGGGGADDLRGLDGNDQIDGGAGNDSVDGGNGIDFAVYTSATSGVTVSLAAAGAQNTVGAGSDTLVSIEAVIGSAFADSLIGGIGVDTLYGMDGNDTLAGGAGADTLAGFNGADTLNGGTGADYLIGGTGNDTFQFASGDGQDIVHDFAAGDNVRFTGYTAAQSLTQVGANAVLTLSGTDRVTFLNAAVATVQAAIQWDTNNAPVFGTEGNDILAGTAGADDLRGLGGNDQIEGGAGNDFIDGGSGIDFAVYSSATAGVSVDLGAVGPQNTGGAGIDTLVSIEAVIGSAFADSLTGGSGVDTLYGMDGNDTLVGGAGADTLAGFNGADTLNGGAGDDYLIGGTDNDTFAFGAGDGRDIVHDLASGDVVRITGYTSGTMAQAGADVLLTLSSSDQITFRNAIVATVQSAIQWVTAVNGTENNDVLSGTAGSDDLRGLGGNDQIDGGAGDDSIDGGSGIDFVVYTSATSGVSVNLGISGPQATGAAGIDTLTSIEAVIGSAFADTLTGGSGVDTVYGMDGDDFMFGNGGNDTLGGFAGADMLNGGAGNDYLIGGAGADRYVFDGTPGNDQIHDFQTGSDKIDLTAFGITSAQVSAASSGANTLLSIDSNHDGIADFTITLLGVGAPSAADYIF